MYSCIHACMCVCMRTIIENNSQDKNFRYCIYLLNQARWFLEIDPVHKVCVCVLPPGLLITSGVMWRDMDPM